jgi:Domain of unknown function (DUF5069)
LLVHPREQIAGVVFMARTIDKMRAVLPGGNIGKYHVDGASTSVLRKIGVDPSDLQKVVAEAQSDEDVTAWLRVHADLSNAFELTEYFLKVGPADVSLELAEQFRNELEAEVASTLYHTFAEALERDDVAYVRNAQEAS